jgi:septal ring factor EnvC (AmiA/AmiB activator)
LATLASEEEGILAARQERISAAEMKLSQLEGRITGCQEEAGVLEDSLSRRRAEVEIEFQKIDSNVRERQRKLSEVEDRLAAIRSAI